MMIPYFVIFVFNALRASGTIAQCPVKNQRKISRCVEGGGGLKMGMGTVSVESKGALEDYNKTMNEKIVFLCGHSLLLCNIKHDSARIIPLLRGASDPSLLLGSAFMLQ